MINLSMMKSDARRYSNNYAIHVTPAGRGLPGFVAFLIVPTDTARLLSYA
jgi:hypothetical protein